MIFFYNKFLSIARKFSKKVRAFFFSFILFYFEKLKFYRNDVKKGSYTCKRKMHVKNNYDVLKIMELSHRLVSWEEQAPGNRR